MTKRASPADVHIFLIEQGLQYNPIEKIVYHRNGSVTIWLTSLNEPVTMPAKRNKEQIK